MAAELRTVLGGLAFPEGPRWRDGELYFSDMHSDEVVAMKPDGSRRTVYRHGQPISDLGWLPDGRMLVVSMNDRKLMRIEADGRAALHAALGGIATGTCNDMVVDGQGRAYVGNFGVGYPPGPPQPAKMARVDADGTTSVAAEDLIFPNGTIITPDGKTLVVGETFGARLTAFDIAADGSLSNRRLWAQMPQGAVPDGICLDAEGAIWVASPTSSEALRVREGGEVTDRIATGRGCYACMLGGPDRKTLYLLVADTSDPAECRANKTASIDAVDVSAPGAGLP
ncbi:MAG TPA: SMP-30/gluconolactonase/LRE family protein [Caulobacteraceae bacterium]|nr:SMP-30/gluconolactonase/LRE family protein [Caulobacteraceae bacterium]